MLPLVAAVDEITNDSAKQIVVTVLVAAVTATVVILRRPVVGPVQGQPASGTRRSSSTGSSSA